MVASNVGGIKLQIKDGENGFLVEPHDIKGFADRVIEILKHPKLAHELGKQGKASVRERFLITRLLWDYLNLIHEMLHS